jgi:hypothetical protein
VCLARYGEKEETGLVPLMEYGGKRIPIIRNLIKK